MARYKIITLVDITRTNPSRTETDPFKIKQQSNFNALVQAINLRSNIEEFTNPEFKNGRLPDNIGGKAKHWIAEFEVEREDVFMKDGDPVGLLIEDLNGVPIVPDLNNSEDLDPAAFITKGKKANIWFTIML